jgi:threonine synthase
MAAAMRWAYEEAGEIIDPHTAIGLHAARLQDLPATVPTVTLATAHPAKFRDAVERATGTRPPLPTRVGDLFAREERFDELPGDYEAVKAHILAKAR